MSVYVKSVAESGIDAMDLLRAEPKKGQLATTGRQEEVHVRTRVQQLLACL